MTRHILIVDDSQTVRAALNLYLREAGYEVTEAIDGVDGLAKLEALAAGGTPPALIITDITMPIMDGIAFTRAVKSGVHKMVPVLVLTSEREERLKEEGRKVGAAGWLLKPFQPLQLQAVIDKLTAHNPESL